MKRFFIVTVASLVALLGWAADKAKHVNAEQAAKLIQEGRVAVLDVRTADEFKEGHVDGAANIDILEPGFADKLAKLDKSKPLLVHCQAGGRSTRALPTLEKLGFQEVYHLDGGMNDWVKAGKPVKK